MTLVVTNKPHCGWLYGGLAGWLALLGVVAEFIVMCADHGSLECLVVLEPENLCIWVMCWWWWWQQASIYLCENVEWQLERKRGVKKPQSGLWHLDIEVHSSAYIFCTRWSRPASDELKSVHNWKGLSGHMHDDARYVPYTESVLHAWWWRRKDVEFVSPKQDSTGLWHLGFIKTTAPWYCTVQCGKTKTK